MGYLGSLAVVGTSCPFGTQSPGTGPFWDQLPCMDSEAWQAEPTQTSPIRDHEGPVGGHEGLLGLIGVPGSFGEAVLEHWKLLAVPN